MVGKPSTCTEQERRSSVSARDNRRALTLRSSFLFYLDVALLILFILCLSPRLTGLPWHEVLGLAFILPTFLHLLTARPWTRLAVKTSWRAGNWRTRINLLLNLTL